MDLGGGGHGGRRSNGIADPPAGHRVALGDSVDDDGPVAQLGVERDDVMELKTIIDDLFVDIVGNNDAVVQLEHAGQSGEFFSAIGSSRRIAWAIQYEEPDIRSQGHLQLLRSDSEATFLTGHEDFGHRSGQKGHVRIAHPVGGRNQDLIAFLQKGLEEIVEGVLGSAANQDFFLGVGEAVLLLVFLDDSLPQGIDASHFRVLGHSLCEGIDGGLFDVFRGVEIRLPRREIRDIHAGRPQLLGLGRDRESHRRFDGFCSLAYFHSHKKSPLEFLF